MANHEKLLGKIDEEWGTLLAVRAHFPHTPKELIGERRCATAPYYQRRGYSVAFEFSSPLIEEQIAKINSLGGWINECYIVRLCAILEDYKVIPRKGEGKINQEFSGWQDVDLLRRLRNVIAHASGRYNPENRDHKKLFETMVGYLGIRNADPARSKGFPIEIDTVLQHITEGCKQYVRALSTTSAST